MAEDIRNGLYEVTKPQCGQYKAGDVVMGHRLASDQKSMEYLITVGAAKESDLTEEVIISDASAVDLIRKKDAEITSLNAILDERSKQIEDLLKTINEKDAQIATLTKPIPPAK